MKKYFIVLFTILTTLLSAQDYQSVGSYVVMDASTFNLIGNWSVSTSTTGSTGGGYITSSGENFSGENAGIDVISVQIKINTAGTYRFHWRSAITAGISTTDDNDTWIRFPDADNFYANDIGTGTDIGIGTAYPRGWNKTPIIEGSTDKGWMKVYTNTLDWNWTTHTFDNDPNLPYVVFNSPGVYHMEISNRSANHGIDRIVLWNVATGNETTATNISTALTTYTLSGNNGNGAATISGELKNYHKVTIDFAGLYRDEKTATFKDNRFDVTFTSPTGVNYKVPGYFAADGNAANTGATEGNVWRVNFTPEQTGTWAYNTSFRTGNNIAVSLLSGAGTALAPLDNISGTFNIADTDKTGKDFRGKGKLEYVDKTFLQFSNGEYFYKVGADSPEVFLEAADFDNTFAPTRTYPTHIADWVSGDPTWDGAEKGKGVIGVINYLSTQDMNVHYFMVNNSYGDGGHVGAAQGKGGEVTPTIGADALYRYDVSKLGQWQILFDEMMKKGVMTQFVLSEQEDQSYFELRESGTMANSRKVFFREMVARFGYLNAITWNIGEENGWNKTTKFGRALTTAQRLEFGAHMNALVYYNDNITIHNGPSSQARIDLIFNDLLGTNSFTGIAFQGQHQDASYNDGIGTYDRIKYFRDQSIAQSKPWVISYDEPYSSSLLDTQTEFNTWRKNSLWTSIMAGAAGIELYYGGSADLTQQNYRDFSVLWGYQAHAKNLFYDHNIPLQEMVPDRTIVQAANYALKDTGNRFLVYAFNGGTPTLTTGDSATYDVRWYDPRNGGALQIGNVTSITGGTNVSLGAPPNDTGLDWVVYVNNPLSTTTGMTGQSTTPSPNPSSSKASTGKLGNSSTKTFIGSGSGSSILGGVVSKSWISQCSTCPNSNINVSGIDTYTPINAADMSNATNAGKVAIITNSFSVANTTFAAGQIVQPNGGILTGTGININGARFLINNSQAFAPTARFVTRYTECLSPEIFGADIATADQDAIEAMYLNADMGINKANTIYNISDNTSFPTEVRTFKWSGNNATIENSFVSESNSVYLYDWTNTRVEICDLNIDGNLLTNLAINIDNSDFYMENVKIRHFQGPDGGRSRGVNHVFYSETGRDTRLYNCEFGDFQIEGGQTLITTGGGATRALLVILESVNFDPTNIIYEVRDSNMYSTYGEGDAIHWFPVRDADQDNQIRLLVDGCTFSDNTRRDIKTQGGKLTATNNTFTKISSTSPWATLDDGSYIQTVNVGVSLRDNVSSTEYHRNAYIANNTFKLADGDEEGWSSYLGISHTLNTIVENNIFTRPKAGPFNAVAFSAKNPGLIIRNNQMTNVGISAANSTPTIPDGNIIIENNTFDYTAYWGAWQMAIIQGGVTSAVVRDIIFQNNTVNVDFPTSSSTTNFKGIIGTRDGWSNVGFLNNVITNNTVTYTGSFSTNARFSYFAGNFGNTNTISNHVVNGITASGAFEVLGSDQSFISTNNTNNLGQTLTKQ